MQYNKTADGKYVRLAQANVDTGMGVERTSAVLQGLDDVFLTDLFAGLLAKIKEISGKQYDESTARPMRIIADHMRAATFMIADGVSPSNVQQGYILRRLLRRAIRFSSGLGMPDGSLLALADVVIADYGDVYPELVAGRARIADELTREEAKFGRTLTRGLREFEKVTAGVLERGESQMPPADSLKLHETYGFPIDLTRELAAERGIRVDMEAFAALFREFQEKSRGTGGSFKGGLADHSEQTTKLHTATHLMHKALRQVLGTHVQQVGSNITPERLRFDFTHPERVTEEQLREVAVIVNARIAENLPVTMLVEPLSEALAGGALAFFGDRYGEVVKVYTIGGFSKEVCGGPHVNSTGELGHFRILKEEAVGQGKRRIRASVESIPG
jgi:alanyl-tRNA synthetase